MQVSGVFSGCDSSGRAGAWMCTKSPSGQQRLGMETARCKLPELVPNKLPRCRSCLPYISSNTSRRGCCFLQAAAKSCCMRLRVEYSRTILNHNSASNVQHIDISWYFKAWDSSGGVDGYTNFLTAQEGKVSEKTHISQSHESHWKPMMLWCYDAMLWCCAHAGQIHSFANPAVPKLNPASRQASRSAWSSSWRWQSKQSHIHIYIIYNIYIYILCILQGCCEKIWTDNMHAASPHFVWH